MCGINGIFSYHPAAKAPRESELLATRDYMTPRGPDAAGVWRDGDQRVALGHRRLSIIDLSERASQPMESMDGRYVVSYNGEIYNYPMLREELEAVGCEFRTRSDTEVLLHLYARYGASMVTRLRGMFAFAIWDKEVRGLFLARDPHGIKPLYIANDGWTFRFASQVKALLAGGGVSRDPEPAGVVGFHLWGNVPEPFTLYRDIRALPAGASQWIDAAGPREPEQYASIAEALSLAETQPLKDIGSEVRSAVMDSVRHHLVADVEVGLFLSGGVDSGALLGLMRDAGQSRIRTITLAFDEFRKTHEDESVLAATVAKIYDAEHSVRTVTKQEFEEDLPWILSAMDQPSLDGVNTWFVAKAAKESGLKVALTGIGGDEVFAGYPSFSDLPRSVNTLRYPTLIPGVGWLARKLLIAAGVQKRWPKAPGIFEYGGSFAGAYLLRRGVFLPYELRSFLDPDTVETGLQRLKPLALLERSSMPDPGNSIARITALESSNYLRNQLLRDADWGGMAHSLEIRTPFVDFPLLKELGHLLPDFAQGQGKQMLANAPSIPLPSSLTERGKTGFSVPTGRWFDDRAAIGSVSKGQVSRAWTREVISRFSDDSVDAGLPA
jgi:asparagine synthase (glutamine-hydrolysing)